MVINSHNKIIKKIIACFLALVLTTNMVAVSRLEVQANPIVAAGSILIELLGALLASAGITFGSESLARSAAEAFYNSLSVADKNDLKLLTSSAQSFALGLTVTQMKYYYKLIKDYFGTNNAVDYVYDATTNAMKSPAKVLNETETYGDISDRIMELKDVSISKEMFFPNGAADPYYNQTTSFSRIDVLNNFAQYGIPVQKIIDDGGYVINSYGHYVEIRRTAKPSGTYQNKFEYQIDIYNGSGSKIKEQSISYTSKMSYMEGYKYPTKDYLFIIPYSDVGNVASYGISFGVEYGRVRPDDSEGYYYVEVSNIFEKKFGSAITFVKGMVSMPVPLPAENVYTNLAYGDDVATGVVGGGYVDEKENVYVKAPSYPWWKGLDDTYDIFAKPEVFVPDGVVDIETGEIKELPKELPIEVPVGDIAPTGFFGTLLDWLNNFWERYNQMLDRFAAAFAGTLVGTARIDFSKFNKNINFVSIFPFCIPFDFVNAVKSLNVAPKTPSWVIDFSGTVLGDTKVKIDLGQFESLAKIVRFFVFMTFAIGMMVGTRNFIKW